MVLLDASTLYTYVCMSVGICQMYTCPLKTDTCTCILCKFTLTPLMPCMAWTLLCTKLVQKHFQKSNSAPRSCPGVLDLMTPAIKPSQNGAHLPPSQGTLVTVTSYRTIKPSQNIHNPPRTQDPLVANPLGTHRLPKPFGFPDSVRHHGEYYQPSA